MPQLLKRLACRVMHSLNDRFPASLAIRSNAGAWIQPTGIRDEMSAFAQMAEWQAKARTPTDVARAAVRHYAFRAP